MKDVESVRPDDIHIAAVRPRGDVRDRLIGAESIDALKQGAVVGTSSKRRTAQLLRLRPDLKIVPLRGNVETRLAKVEVGRDRRDPARRGRPQAARHRHRHVDPDRILLPAPAQAVIGMECRTNDTETQSVLSTVNNQITFACVMAERAFTRALGATCASPVAAFAVLEDGDLSMRAQLFSEDGSEMVEQRAVFDCGDDQIPPPSPARCWPRRRVRSGGCSRPDDACGRPASRARRKRDPCPGGRARPRGGGNPAVPDRAAGVAGAGCR